MEPMDRNIESREVVSIRAINAPRATVYRAWTEPNHLANWWGPEGFTTTTLKFDLEPGGMWEFIMHSPDGKDYDNKIIFSEVVKPERLYWEHVSEPNFYVTTDFVEHLGKTNVILRTLFGTAEECERAKKDVLEANEQSFIRLEAELERMRAPDTIVAKKLDNFL